MDLYPLRANSFCSLSYLSLFYCSEVSSSISLLAVFYFYCTVLMRCFFLFMDSSLIEVRWFIILTFFSSLYKVALRSKVFFSKCKLTCFSRSFMFLSTYCSYLDHSVLVLISSILCSVFSFDSFALYVFVIPFRCSFSCNVLPSMALIYFLRINTELITSLSYFLIVAIFSFC